MTIETLSTITRPGRADPTQGQLAYQTYEYAWSTPLGLDATPSASGVQLVAAAPNVTLSLQSSLMDARPMLDEPVVVHEPPRSPQQIAAEVSVNRDLAEIADLEPGWLDGHGEIISRRAIQKAKSVLVDLLTSGVPHPQVVPTPEGGVQAEWSLDRRASSITFEPTGDIYVFSIDLDTRETTELTLPAHDASPIGDTDSVES